MIRIACQNGFAIGRAFGELAEEKASDRPLVVRLGELRARSMRRSFAWVTASSRRS